mmetsp:Transcript_42925/g.93233  ORF Transcript_42925/g.93233 Transcript_42925/m.93233 type:complete len:112 (-) Transcript_42925:1122-1457(-)
MAFFLPYISFLKVDVEGHELAVLQGAKWMLRQHRIGALQFEYGGTFLDAGCSLRDICELLTPLGYSVFREIEKGGLAHIAHWEDQHEDFQIHNILAVVSEAVPGYQPMSGL